MWVESVGVGIEGWCWVVFVNFDLSGGLRFDVNFEEVVVCVGDVESVGFMN